jgi:hypothetical protein
VTNGNGLGVFSVIFSLFHLDATWTELDSLFLSLVEMAELDMAADFSRGFRSSHSGGGILDFSRCHIDKCWQQICIHNHF